MDAEFMRSIRDEMYAIPPGTAGLLQEIERHLPLVEFRKGYTFSHISSIQFDAEERNQDTQTLRVKEYSYQDTQDLPGWLVKLLEVHAPTRLADSGWDE
jgi:hypothetical protein